jgi:hypothetical protein
VYIT